MRRFRNCHDIYWFSDKSHREMKKGTMKCKFEYFHQRYKPIDGWVQLPFMGRRCR